MMLTTSGKMAVVLLSLLLALAPVARSRDGRAESGEAGSADFPQQAEVVQDETLRVDTNLITVPASVMDREGRYITNLQREDFRLFEDGIEQEISFFAPVDTPFTIIFLLDVSGSMHHHMHELARAANTFLHRLRVEDQLIVASFDGKVDVICELSKVNDVWGARTFGLRLANDGAPITMVYDAVDFALKRMRKIDGRKAIVLFSDGIGSGAKGTLGTAEDQDAQIYTVQFNTSDLRPGYKKRYYEQVYKDIETATNYMKGLAEKTGGTPLPSGRDRRPGQDVRPDKGKTRPPVQSGFLLQRRLRGGTEAAD